LQRCARNPLQSERLVDTLALARRRHPGGPNRLDDLCVRYGIDNSRRTRHGALLDAEILSEVYLELIGGRQASLVLLAGAAAGFPGRNAAAAVAPRPVPLVPRISEAERDAHARFVATLGEKAIWLDYFPFAPPAPAAERRALAS
jgi:DNA polymerase-3 subunit epsilon